MSLREELGRIPGVIDADIDLRDGQPTAIRIHSGEGADQRAIGEAVQHALRRHGLRSRVAPPRREPEPASAPAPPHLSLMPSREAVPTHAEQAEPGRRITSVSVRDDGSRSMITVSDDRGGLAEERTRRSPESQINAVARAVAHLSGRTDQEPELVSVRRWERDGHRFVTVVLDVEGSPAVGSALDDGLELRAVAVAVWQALHS